MYIGEPILKSAKGVLRINPILPRLNSKTEISYFSLISLDKDVGSLDISMNDVFRIKVVQPLINILEENPSLIFRKDSLFRYFITQCPTLTKLGKAMTLLNSFQHIKTLNNVLMRQSK